MPPRKSGARLQRAPLKFKGLERGRDSGFDGVVISAGESAAIAVANIVVGGAGGHSQDFERVKLFALKIEKAVELALFRPARMLVDSPRPEVEFGWFRPSARARNDIDQKDDNQTVEKYKPENVHAAE